MLFSHSQQLLHGELRSGSRLLNAVKDCQLANVGAAIIEINVTLLTFRGWSERPVWLRHLADLADSNGHIVRGHDGLVQSIPIRRQSQCRESGKQVEMAVGS